MRIKTTTTEEKEINVATPFFCKKTTADVVEYIAAITEDLVVSIYNSPGLIFTKTCDPRWETNTDKAAQRIDRWQECSEEEFLSAHENAIAAQSLKPVLKSAQGHTLTELKEY